MVQKIQYMLWLVETNPVFTLSLNNHKVLADLNCCFNCCPKPIRLTPSKCSRHSNLAYSS